MRRTGILTLALAALCAVAAFAASGAYAELPEIGRCVKLEGLKEGHKTKYSGKYSNRKCTKTSSSSTGKFEWMPGAGTEKTFESPGTLEPVTLKTRPAPRSNARTPSRTANTPVRTPRPTKSASTNARSAPPVKRARACGPKKFRPRPKRARSSRCRWKANSATSRNQHQAADRLGIQSQNRLHPVCLRMWRPRTADRAADYAAGRRSAGTADDAGSAEWCAECAEYESADSRHDRRRVHLTDPQAGRQDGRKNITCTRSQPAANRAPNPSKAAPKLSLTVNIVEAEA